jgi:phosphoribosylformylglycinamidine synthase
MLRLYSRPGLEPGQVGRIVSKAKALGVPVVSLDTEFCFNVDVTTKLSSEQHKMVEWCLTENGHSMGSEATLVADKSGMQLMVEVGPRFNFTSAWSTNCVSVLKAAEVPGIPRVERSRRHLFTLSEPWKPEHLTALLPVIHDRMTEMLYEKPVESFDAGYSVKPVKWVPVLSQGRKALEEINAELGLGFDDWDYEYYMDLYKNDLKRDPSDVELFDFAQSNSEHSRHWFFGGNMVIDGVQKKDTLFRLVKDTLDKNPNANKNSVIAFADNSSSIVGPKVKVLSPAYNVDKTLQAGVPTPLIDADLSMDLIYTAETHNMPTGVCPFAGAETGTGGRLRDVQATGVGASYICGTIGYCVGALNMIGDNKPYEKPFANEAYPSTMASPLDILIEGSNGASDYGTNTCLSCASFVCVLQPRHFICGG